MAIVVRPNTATLCRSVPVPRVLLTTVVGGLSWLAMVAPLRGQDSVPAFVVEHYDRHDLMVPTRDGVRLRTVVFTPKDTSTAYPILLTRTPYGADELFPSGRSRRIIRASGLHLRVPGRPREIPLGRHLHRRPAVS